MRIHTTVIIEEDVINSLRDYAYTERITVSESLERAIRHFLEDKRDQLISRPDKDALVNRYK